MARPLVDGVWDEPRRPWSLELLTLVSVAAGLATPLILHAIDPTRAMVPHVHTSLQILFWPALILGVYIVHQMIVRSTPDHLSTPFSYLFAPTLAAILCYACLSFQAREAGIDIPLLAGTAAHYLLLAAGMLAATVLLSHFHMLGQFRRYRGIAWELEVPTMRDASYWPILGQLYPLIFRPTRFFACREGILVRGWHFIMPLPFSDIRSVGHDVTGDLSIAGHYFATSGRHLLRVDLSDSKMPIFLSPDRHEEFYQYCVRHLGMRRTGTSGGTKAGGTEHGLNHHSFYKRNHGQANAAQASGPGNA